MSGADPVGAFLGAFGDSLQSSMFGIITTPAAGWVATLLGLGSSDAGDTVDPALAQRLSKLQDGVDTILTDLGNLQKSLQNYISAIADTTNIQSAVTAVQVFQHSGPPKTVPVDMLFEQANGDSTLLVNVHDILAGSAADGSQPNTTGYLTTLLQSHIPYYNADSAPRVQNVGQVFTYYQELQAILMQMMVEAAHQGQTATIQADPNDHSGSLPPNYAAAVQAYNQYNDQVALQSTFLPLPTSGVGYNEANAFFGGIPCLGAGQIVFDRSPAQATRPFGWGSQNYRCFGGRLCSLQWVQDQLSNAAAWMLRIPTYAELVNLRKWLTDDSGNAVDADTIGNSLQQTGFYITLAADENAASEGGFPFVTNEALQSGNWTILNYREVTVGAIRNAPGHAVPVADGYQCDWFYDLWLGVSVTVSVYCPVTNLQMNQTIATDAVFTDILQATSISWSSTLASLTLTAEDLAQESGFIDALFIYQLANVDATTGVSTDRQLEEPSSLQINSVNNADGTVTLTASSTFQRFDRTAQNYVPVTFNVANVYWRLADADAGNATISQSGVVTWIQNNPVSPTVMRGTLSANLPSLSPPPSFTAPPAPTPSIVNIYPRKLTFTAASLANQPQGVAFNGQMLWSDGSTSTFGDGASSSGGQFTFTFAEANGHLSLDSQQTNSFTIPAGTTSGTTFQINLAVNGEALTDMATIRIT